jgi:hypothetical protein
MKIESKIVLSCPTLEHLLDSWGPTNLVASCVTELNDSLPPYGCYT